MQTCLPDLLPDLLQLGDDWEITEVRYSELTGTLTVEVRATEAWFARQMCPSCRSRQSGVGDQGKKQIWRHLDGCRAKTLIACALSRAKCLDCGHLFQAKPTWQGTSRHFTKDFEAFALNVIRETTVRSASRVLCESDHRLWRMLYAYVGEAHGELSTLAISILHREWKQSA